MAFFCVLIMQIRNNSWQHCLQLWFSGCCVIRDMLRLFSVMEVFLILFPIQLSVMTTPINTYSYSIPTVMAHKLNGRVNHIECDVEASLVFGPQTSSRSLEKVFNAGSGFVHWLPVKAKK